MSGNNSTPISTFEPYDTIEVEAEHSKTLPRTALKHTLNQLYAKPLPKTHRHTDNAHAHHDVTDRIYLDRSNDAGHIHVTTITGSISSVEQKARRKSSNTGSKTSSFKPPVPRKTHVAHASDHKQTARRPGDDVVHEHESKQTALHPDGERDSGFSDASQSNGHAQSRSSDEGKLNSDTHHRSRDTGRVQAPSATRHPQTVKPTTNSAFVNELTKVHKKRQAPQPRAYPTDVTNAARSGGPNNLKQFHVRKPSKRNLSNAQCTPVEQPSQQRVSSSSVRAPAQRAPATSTSVLYSDIDFGKTAETVRTFSHSSSTDSLNTTWSQSADEQEVAESKMAAADSRQHDNKYQNRYKKATPSCTSAAAPVQKRTRRSRSKHGKPDADVSQERGAGNSKPELIANSAVADDDVTIQIQLKMLNSQLCGSRISLANQNGEPVTHTDTSSGVSTSKGNHHGDPPLTNRKRPGSQKSAHRSVTSSKPAPSPKPQLVIAPKPALKYTAKMTSAQSEFNMSDF